MALVPHGGGAGGSASMPMPMLTVDNYTVWVIKAQAILDVHTVWEAVAPGDAAVNARKDKTARALLLGALPEDVLLQVSTKLTAKEVWDSLKVRFVGADRVRAARLATLRGEFDRLKMADGEELDVYGGRLAAMAARYANLGEALATQHLSRSCWIRASRFQQKPCSIRSKVIFLHGRRCSIRAGASGGGRRRSGLLFFPAVEKRPRPVDPRALVLAVAATWAAREAAQHVGVADDPEEEEECLVQRSVSYTLPPRAPRRYPTSHGVIQVQGPGWYCQKPCRSKQSRSSASQ
ncbi:unnamed protein product [Triticum aestivum]|uniref:Uncharacterized protein n=1 Tax=Triticum aestivum TaxID=4565 RepID=A0A7H4LED3_WHEAT|nr:unnamed protein product [Triticum aestivum]